MDFDLSLIDQVEENKDSAPARASKFVPRAIARSRPVRPSPRCLDGAAFLAWLQSTWCALIPKFLQKIVPCEDDLEANQNDEGGQGPFIQNSFRISHQDALPCSSQAGTVYTDCALDVKTASQLPIKVILLSKIKSLSDAIPSSSTSPPLASCRSISSTGHLPIS